MAFRVHAKSKIHIRWLGALSVIAMVAMAPGAEAQAPGSQSIAPTQTQTATAQSFDMPLGHVESPSAGTLIEVRRPGIPIGSAKLNQIKAQAAGQAAPVSVVSPAAAKNEMAPNAIGTSCQTNSANSYTPSDIHGAVGQTNLVVVTNVLVGVYAKSTCATISSVTLKTFFGTFTIPATQTLFDPQIVYSAADDRFIITAESEDSANTDQYQYLAVSKDNTGTSWWVYRITMSSGTTAFCKQLYSLTESQSRRRSATRFR